MNNEIGDQRGQSGSHWKLTLLVLLVLVVADHLSEQRGVLRAQLLRHGGRCRTVGGVLFE